MKVLDDHFDRQFTDNLEGKKAACRHAAFLYNQMQEQTERYTKALEGILEQLGKLPGVTLALDITELLRVETE